MTHLTYSFVRAATRKKLDRIVEMLADKPMTAVEIAAALPAAKRTTTSYLAYLRGMSEHGKPGGPRRVRIADWRIGPHQPEALFAPGDAPDKAKPEARTVTQRRRDLRNRLAQEAPEELRRRRLRRQLKRSPPRRDPMIAALFGNPA